MNDETPNDVTTHDGPCEECLADRRRAALIGVGIGVAVCAGTALLILPLVRR